MRHQRTVYPKKFLPLGSRRVTLSDGTRAWLIQGKAFPSKRAYFEWREAQRNISDLIDKGYTPEQAEAEQAGVAHPEKEPAESEAENV